MCSRSAGTVAHAAYVIPRTKRRPVAVLAEDGQAPLTMKGRVLVGSDKPMNLVLHLLGCPL